MLMTYTDDVIAAVQTWMKSLRKDGRFSHSKIRSDLAAFVATLEPLTTLEESKARVSELKHWTSKKIEEGSSHTVVMKTDRRCGELLRAINGLLSRAGFSLADCEAS